MASYRLSINLITNAIVITMDIYVIYLPKRIFVKSQFLYFDNVHMISMWFYYVYDALHVMFSNELLHFLNVHSLK